MSIRTYNIPHTHVIYDDANTEPVRRCEIWFEGRPMIVVAKSGETEAQLWERVLDTLNQQRQVIASSGLHGCQFHTATVYMGMAPTEQQRKKHIKDWISEALYSVADSTKDKDADARVAALGMLARLHGLTAKPRPMGLPTLQELERAIAYKRAAEGLATQA